MHASVFSGCLPSPAVCPYFPPSETMEVHIIWIGSVRCRHEAPFISPSLLVRNIQVVVLEKHCVYYSDASTKLKAFLWMQWVRYMVLSAILAQMLHGGIGYVRQIKTYHLFMVRKNMTSCFGLHKCNSTFMVIISFSLWQRTFSL